MRGSEQGKVEKNIRCKLKVGRNLTIFSEKKVPRLRFCPRGTKAQGGGVGEKKIRNRTLDCKLCNVFPSHASLKKGAAEGPHIIIWVRCGA